jgi:hypothetical protein
VPFGTVLEGIKIRIVMPQTTSLRFWEAKDPKNPLGFEVRCLPLWQFEIRSDSNCAHRSD